MTRRATSNGSSPNYAGTSSFDTLKATPPEEGWAAPLNLTTEHMVSLASIYRETCTNQICQGIVSRVGVYNGWKSKRWAEEQYLLKTTFTELHRVLSEGMPPMRRQEAKQQDSDERRHKYQLDRVERATREELKEGTHENNIAAKTTNTLMPTAEETSGHKI